MPSFETRLIFISRSLRSCLFFVVVAGFVASLGCANGEIRLGDPFDRELTLEGSKSTWRIPLESIAKAKLEVEFR